MGKLQPSFNTAVRYWGTHAHEGMGFSEALSTEIHQLTALNQVLHSIFLILSNVVIIWTQFIFDDNIK